MTSTFSRTSTDATATIAALDRCPLGGEWVGADSGAGIEVRNPADGSVIGTVPDMGRDETRRAVGRPPRRCPPGRDSPRRSGRTC
jgi:acyl-CoA reductase-like NAD-dependent aldehyde dehydrogenase